LRDYKKEGEMKAAVAIDEWKLLIFKKALDKKGYKYTKHQTEVPQVLILKVEYEDLGKLTAIVRKTDKKAARSRMH
jgi:hypothetical protein